MAMKGPRTVSATINPAIDIKQVWIDYKKEKTERLRNTLMENIARLEYELGYKEEMPLHIDDWKDDCWKITW